jgi:hypothetical protein
MTTAIARQAKTKSGKIQSGDSTHHLDHSMKCVSLRTMNAIASRPKNGVPLGVELEDVVIVALHVVRRERGQG